MVQFVRVDLRDRNINVINMNMQETFGRDTRETALDNIPQKSVDSRSRENSS